MVLAAQKTANADHHQVQHIRISLDTNFHLKQTILKFWTEVAQGYFWSKTEKLCITIGFSIFELVRMQNSP